MDWQIPTELPDLRRVGIIALDTETRDGGLLADRGSGWPWRDGHVCGISVAWHESGNIRACYIPIKHPDSQNFDSAQVFQWLRDLIASDVRIVTQNGLYDFGWLRTEADIRMPPSERLEEIGALATIVDENRYRYSLDALCAWRDLPGKDETLLKQAAEAAGLLAGRKKPKVQTLIWRLPAQVVGPYAEADAVNTLALWGNLNPILDREGTRGAYRLEVDLLPMIHEMRRRGIRIDHAAAERTRDLILQKRDAAFAELSEKLGANVGMDEIGRTAWLAQTFDKQTVRYPQTQKGNPSFTAGTTGWMHKHPHWLPQLIVKADKYNNAAVNVLENYILGHTINGRIHAEIHPHRSDEGGTRSLRFSYSDPPLQLTPSRDDELAPLIRGVFLPEEGEVWAKPDVSQQEFRFIVHYAAVLDLPRAKDAAERYHNDPDADFHNMVVEMTGLGRTQAKNTNFAKSFGAGVRKFAAMIGKPESEARTIFERYDRELPFVSRLATRCQNDAARQGYIALYDGARRHWDSWEAPGVAWEKGSGPCAREEAERRVKDPTHPWYGRRYLRRAETHKAMNALIQGSAARHTKLWMRACWREGIVPLLQMHDSLDCSVTTKEQGELVARLGCQAVTLKVPMRVDLKFGKTWGDAKHTWAELNGAAPQIAATASMISIPESRPLTASKDTPPPPPQPAPPPPLPSSGPKPNGQGQYSQSEHNQPERGQCIAPYVYLDAAGRNYLLVKRYEWFTTAADGSQKKQKSFPQYRWTGTQWVKGCKGEHKIPFRLPELLAAPRATLVAICAGEKDVLTLARLGYVATCNPGGEVPKAWTPELNCWFVGRPVLIVEDNDDTGQAHTREVAQALHGVAASIKALRFPDVPEHEDVTWWVEHGHGREDLEARINVAPSAIRELDDWDAGDDTGPPMPRSWLLGGQFCRTFLSGLVAPGATGKTALRLLQAIALAAGRPLTGQRVYRRCRVLVVSFEDDQEELKRRLLAARLYHRVGADELKGWLFLASPKGLKLVELRNGNRIVGALEPALRHAIERRRPDLIVLDPFVKLHGLEENDNSAMDYVADLLTQLAHEYNIAIDSPAHTRKGLTQAGDADARRGASAARDAGRLDYTLIPMSEDEARTFGIASEDRRSYLRLDSAKVNLLPPARKAEWFALVSVELGNATADYPEGDWVQTVEPWIPPDIWAELDPETLNATLDEIEAGLPNGQRYSGAPSAKERATWPVVQKHCPTKTETQCREIVRTWIEKHVLEERDYDDPVRRKIVSGLWRGPNTNRAP